MTAPEETTPRWEVDEDGTLIHIPGDQGTTHDSYIARSRNAADGAHLYITEEGWAALQATVRAAREHERCPRDIDTLRRALDEIMRKARLLNTGQSDDQNLLDIAMIAAHALLTTGTDLSGETD